jgi:hypothetical protein
MVSDRERQQWTEYVRQMEAKTGKKPRARRTKKRPAPAPAEMGAELDDLVREAELTKAGS